MVNMSAKFDEEAQNGLVAIVLTSLLLYEPRHAKKVLRVILIKMFIFLFPECALF